jgi:hypothetical protein
VIRLTKSNNPREEPLCPSYTCAEGAALIGIIGSEGRVQYLGTPLTVDRRFVAEATEGRPPEQRFRFAAPCAKTACAHWADAECKVVELALAASAKLADDSGGVPDALPACAIRSECRWFAQRGRDACDVCPSIFNFHPATATP